jgi:glyoxylase-like metal-dependent hydrolase (beta-lactamase superfamily II)
VGNIIFTGDTLFAGSIGRSDFPGGSFEQLMESIKNKLLIQDDDVIICPGHGIKSTIKQEKDTNPFLR